MNKEDYVSHRRGQSPLQGLLLLVERNSPVVVKFDGLKEPWRRARFARQERKVLAGISPSTGDDASWKKDWHRSDRNPRAANMGRHGPSAEREGFVLLKLCQVYLKRLVDSRSRAGSPVSNHVLCYGLGTVAGPPIGADSWAGRRSFAPETRWSTYSVGSSRATVKARRAVSWFSGLWSRAVQSLSF